MCLIVIKGTKAVTARKPLIVYKMVGRNEAYPQFVYAPYNGMEYEIGKLYTTKIEKVTNGTISPFDGLDAMALKKRYGDRMYFSDYHEIEWYGAGFHSAKTIERLAHHSRYRIYQCTIPKGAQYIRGLNNLIVSSQIIINHAIIS